MTAQLIANVVDFGVCAETAVKAPRVHTDGGEPLEISSRVDESVKADLIAMKHRVERAPAGQEYTDVGGPANVVVMREGKISAASEAGQAASCVV